jgi:hypothetical protein
VPNLIPCYLPNEPDRRDAAEYSAKIQQLIRDLELTDEHNLVFLEVTVTDPSDFESRPEIHGEVMHEQYRVLTMGSTNVPNPLAALLLEIRDLTGCRPRIYLDRTEGNPLSHLLRYIFFGVGEVAPVTREILRRPSLIPCVVPTSTPVESQCSDGQGARAEGDCPEPQSTP